MSLAVHVSAIFFDQVIEDTFADRGRSIVLGGPGVMALPLPQGDPWFATVSWRGPATAVVERPSGESHLLERDAEVVISEGPVELRIRLIERYPLRRLPSFAAVLSALGGVALLVVPLVGMLGLAPAQLGATNQAICRTWVGQVLPPDRLPAIGALFEACPTDRPSGMDRLASEDRVAEYLERLLRKDFDGEDTGQIAKGDRQHGEREGGDFYLPAGDAGPARRMGGATETGLRPERHPGQPKKPEEPPPPRDPDPALTSEQGTPVELPVHPEPDEPEEPKEEVEVAEAELDRPEDRIEDREGWGIRDWYDQKQRDEDRERIRMMTRLAERLVRIDPDDPNALNLLSLYQYLNEDYDGAIKTYDRFLELYPESAMAYNNKALVYKRLGRYTDEEALYRIALSLTRNDTTTLNNLAVNLAHQKRFDEALSIMADLERRDPDDPYAHLHRAKIYAEMGDDERALHYLELSLELMARLGTMHSIEFRQDIRLDPSFDRLRTTRPFRELLWRYYGDDTPVPRD